MNDLNLIRINLVIKDYFDKNPNIKIIACKDLMPNFIHAKIFKSDTKNGLPIRKILRKLDKENQLKSIPFVVAKRNLSNTNWFFCPNPQFTGKEIIAKNKRITTKQKSASRKDSDEQYVIDLCDEILELKGSRQHRFDFLLGDNGKNGTRAKLPVDVYYKELNLVIEFKEQQHKIPINHFDKPNILTLSGVHRGEQRKIYDLRRIKELPKHGIMVVEIFYDLFECSRQNKLIRNAVKDLEIVKGYLKQFPINK
jgi:hypothetical protein